MIIKYVFEDHRGHINGNTGQEGVNYTQYDAIKDLLLLQPYIKQVERFIPPPGFDYSPMSWPGMIHKINYDLDRSRLQMGRKYIFHVQRYFDTFGITEDWRNYIPWLTIDEENKRTDNYAIFHITDRWHGFFPDWLREFENAKDKYDKVFFTGYYHDYIKFIDYYKISVKWLPHLPTGTLLDLARVVRDAQAVYCNQNCALVIAQGLGKKYYLARNADRTHCHTLLENEILL